MTTGTAISNEHASTMGSRAGAGFEILMIFLLFFIQGAWPVPEVNEAHYLSKARHYWDATWCQKDFFCNAADAHQVFYWTFGWLTLWLPLPTVAWTGRILTWLLLAWTWRRLSVAIVAARFASVLSAGLFITLLHRAHLAGEWVIGGVEAKGFAFAFGLLGLEAVVRDRWNRAWLWLGVASAFHVLVGGWLVVAAGFAWLTMRLGDRDKPGPCSIWALLAGGVLALPGLIPAAILMRGVDPAIAAEASRIYVFERLSHHLVPQSVPWNFLLRFTAMLAAWLLLIWKLRATAPERRLQAVVNGSLAIAAIGLAISFVGDVSPERTAGLLRYYWFRTSDVMLPLGLGLLLTSLLVRRSEQRSGVALLLIAMAAIGWHLTSVMRERANAPVPPADKKLANWKDWRSICQWVSENTPENAVFLTPRMASTFRWYANRAEVVNWKDIPQDAAGIVEWWERMNNVHRPLATKPTIVWRRTLTWASPAELVLLGNKYGAEYLITESLPPLPFELISPPNPSYAVYRLPKSWPEKPAWGGPP